MDVIMQSLAAKGLFFPEELVANYLLALQTKRFVILTGISGTGKTQLAIAVAMHYRPTVRTSEPANVPEGTFLFEVKPYMLKWKSMAIPKEIRGRLRTPQPGEGTKGAAKIRVLFPEGQVELNYWSEPGGSLGTLYPKGTFKEWFSKFQPGDKLLLRIDDSDESEFSSLVFSAPQLQEREEPLDNCRVVAVRPDWTDNRGLLGYFNPLTGKYSVTPVLELLLGARGEVENARKEGRSPRPYFIILDEMNLAHVEQYFSDFLSGLESGEPIDLHQEEEIETGADQESIPVPRRFAIPENVFFTGTVNVDETTYMFSPKVLDRAFTIELHEVDLQHFGHQFDNETVKSALHLQHLPPMLEPPEKVSVGDWNALRLLDGTIQRCVIALNSLLARYNRHYGYRVANEVSRFVTLAGKQAANGEQARWTALDLALLEKVLPKFHGTQEELDEPLRAVFTFAIEGSAPSEEAIAGWEDISKQWSIQGGSLVSVDGSGKQPKLPRFAAKVYRMLRRLYQQGFTAFIE